MEVEIWKDVVGYEGLYKVSNLGKIISCQYGKERILKNKDASKINDYYRIVLCKDRQHKTVRLHRLIAEAFLPDWNSDLEVDHIDRNKLNNSVKNLRMVTHSMNGHNKIMKNKTGFIGISKHNEGGYVGSIRISGINHYTGWSKDLLECANKYDKYIIEKTNLIKPLNKTLEYVKDLD